MGTCYSIKLYYPVGNIDRALNALAGIANSTGNLHLRLPNRQTLSLPFELCSYKPTPAHTSIPLELHQKVRMRIDLLFPDEPALYDYNPARDVVMRDGKPHRPLGAIDLTVTCGERYAEFSYEAITDGMSHLLLKSSSIRGEFSKLLAAGDGMLGLVDVGSGEYALLEDTNLWIGTHVFNASDVWQYPHPPLHSLDARVENLLRMKSYQQTFWQKLDDASAFYGTWIAPLTEDINHWQLPHELGVERQEQLVINLQRLLVVVTDDVIMQLLADNQWRSHWAAAWYVALGQRRERIVSLREVLLRSPYDGRLYIFALVYLGTSESAQILERYLETHLHPHGKSPHASQLFRFDWILAGLQILDQRLGTNRLGRWLVPGGPWEAFVQHGIDVIFEGDVYQQYYGTDPERMAKFRKYWQQSWSLAQAHTDLLHTFQFVARIVER
ncbi:MAG: hypothetical protein JNJ61_19355 [Anaerolineae bacterium]|nr:hypothetical protein [Anaerolineae bacterium]